MFTERCISRLLLLLGLVGSARTGQVSTSTAYRPKGYCSARSGAPLHVPGPPTCPPVASVWDDKTSPWTTTPLCSTTDSTDYCLFATSAFRNGHGISLVSSPHVAAELAGHDAFADAPDPRRPRPPKWRLDHVGGGRGRGAVASGPVRRGEVIVADVPALLLDTAFLRAVRPHHRRRLLRRALAALPEATQAEVLGLSHGDGPQPLDGILALNAHGVGMDDGRILLALFPNIARINHSCRPNAYLRFHPSRLTAEIISYTAIPAGHEILISYAPLADSRDDRQAHLLQHWGFTCTCALCRLPAAAAERIDSEFRRRRTRELETSVYHAMREGYFQDAVHMAREWAMFAEQEALPVPEHELNTLLAGLYEGYGDLANATRHARIALDGWLRLGSVDGEQRERARVMLERVVCQREGAKRRKEVC
ncbi:hypothetical protein P8C59_000832 [Phyllachora maydis]|uniref:SET domain-containing protein n=1 Tax=Phyllachora maydis TaxID=1825666 RepID=A0AAD9MBL9_9PEZI|nr:hypothetical protein P8C59_000832 [Phyllachora maydis]